MKYKLIFFVFSLFIFGCETDHEINKRSREYLNRKLIYIKDDRVDICYGYVGDGNGSLLATVPCEKVEKLLIKHSFECGK
jgi:hypothetical protein